MQTIYTRLKGYAQKGMYPFHMPGHKGGRAGGLSELAQIDITEIDGFDNLHQPTGMLLEAKRRCASVFGAEESFFLVNGSTSGMEAALLAVCSPGEEVIVARNCHRSVYSGLVFSGAKPVYFYPPAAPGLGVSSSIPIPALRQTIERHPKSKAVVITSPTYEGFVSDIQAIRQLTSEHNMALIVDEAHGAHFGFHPLFPKSAIHFQADIVVQSLHKTLPSLTQTAVLHTNGECVDRGRLRHALQMVQSSSPSYLLMASIDECVCFLLEKGETAFKEYTQRLWALREKLEVLENIQLINKRWAKELGIYDIDLGKLCLLLPNGSYTGTQALKYLRQKHQIELEMAGLSHILAMTSVADTGEGFSKLLKGVQEMDKNLKLQKATANPKPIDWPTPEMALSPREGYFASKEKIPFQYATGRICGEFLIPYPPGIPMVAPGEKLSQDSIHTIRRMQCAGISIAGCDDPQLNHILVVK